MATISCLLLLGLSAAGVVQEVQGRQRVASIAEEQQVERLFPAVAETVSLVEGNDEAALLVAEAVVGQPAAPGGVSSAPAALWLVLRGLSGRPGSAYGRLLLGRSAAIQGDASQWVRPLELAVVAAPGLDFASAELGRRYLVRWGALTPEQRQAGLETLRRAFRSESFLRTAWATAVATLGPEVAVGALPDDAATLRLAEQLASEAGNGAAANLIAARLRAVSDSPPASRPSP
jgi:hypothetical protein